jgi:hypothetical protein
VKDDVSALPLQPDESVFIIETEQAILTPGDASDCERPCLGEEVSKLTSGAAAAAVVPFAPTAADIASMVDPAERIEVVVVATVFAVGPIPLGHGLGR